MDLTTTSDPGVTLNVENSLNPDFLSELSQSHLDVTDATLPMVMKANNGRLSPIRSRTMKEYETQIGELKKENFSLKLRIYYMDERMQQKFGDDDVFKTNIELKVELDSVKKDLTDKQEILKKASAAMQNLTLSHQEEITQLRQQHQAALRSIQSPLEKQLQASQQELYLSKKELEASEARLKSLEGELRMHERNKQDADCGKEDQEKQAAENQKLLEKMAVTLKAKTSRIAQLQEELSSYEETSQKFKDTINKLEAQLENKYKDLEDLAQALEGDQKHLGQSVLDHSRVQDQLAEKEEKERQLDRELTRAKADLETAQTGLAELETELEKRSKQLEGEKAMGTKLKKSIQGFAAAISEKDKKATALCNQLEKKEGELKAAREELHALNLEKLEGIEKQHADSVGNEATVERLTAELRKNSQENERLKRSLTQKDEDTNSFKDLLTKAEQGLKHSEEAVQVLQDQLEKERQRCTDKLESLTQHYQALLADGERQLENNERMLQQFAESLKEKDRQLQDCVMKPADAEDTRDSLLKKFQEKLQERDKAIEAAIKDKFECLEVMDKEIRELKITLLGRDRDIERANQMQLNAEERIDSLETEIHEKEKNLKQLSNQLRSIRKEGEDALDNYTRSLEEKDAIIKRLQTSLSAKDKALEEAAQLSPDVDNVQLQQLKQRLTQKDKLMAELMEERNQAAQNSEASRKENHQKLKDKENEIKQMSEAHDQEVSALAKDLHQLKSDLNKKDFELQTSENRASWAKEQQQQMIAKMRRVLQEKDKIIEALAESVKEKDKLLEQLHGSQSQDQAQSSARLAELRKLKDELAVLQADLQNKEDLIERLKKMNTMNTSGGDGTSTYELHRHIERVVEEQNNETRRLNDALQNERQIYINLNTSDSQRGSNFDVELSAIKSLRNELEEGVERNNRLRAQLEGELKQAESARCDTGESREDAINLKEQIELLRTELEESKRLNASLQACLQENQKLRADGVGRTAPSDISVNAYSFAEPSSLHLDESLLDVLSSEDLRKTVKDLHNQLSDSQRHNVGLKTQLAATESFRDIPGENNLDANKSDTSVSKLKQQLCECREELNRKEVENRGFRFKFALVPDEEIILDDLPNVDELQADLLVMKSMLDSIENVNSKLKQQIQVTGRGENVQSGLNPALVEQMVKEIEELKSELTTAKRELEHKSVAVVNSDTALAKTDYVQGQQGAKAQASQIPRLKRGVSSVPQLNYKRVSTNLHKGSKIPVYKGAVTVLVPDIDTVDLSRPDKMYTLLKQYRQDIVNLQNKLLSTEATVRTQGRRCRYYKALLDQEGLLPSAPYRSQSESCLFHHSAIGEEEELQQRTAASAENQNHISSHMDNGHDVDPREALISLRKALEEKEKVIESLKDKVNVGVCTGACINVRPEDPLGAPANSSSPLPFDSEAQSLQHEVTSLQRQLDDSHQANKILLKNLQHYQKKNASSDMSGKVNTSSYSQTSPVTSPVKNLPALDGSTLLEKDHEIGSLRKQLVESQNICSQLSGQLEELGQLVMEYVQGEESRAVTDSSSCEGNHLLQRLNSTQDLVKDLSTLLDAPDLTTDGGFNLFDQSNDLQNKYQKSLQEIKTLRSQLAQARHDRQAESKKLLAERQHQEKVTKDLREELRTQGCVVESQNTEITRLENYMQQKNKEVTQLQTEVKSLQELTRNLRATASHNVSMRSAAVGESHDGRSTRLLYSYNNGKETESESVYSDESWDALEREGYRPVGSTSNLKSRGKLRVYPETDSMDSTDDVVDASHRASRTRPPRKGMAAGAKKSNTLIHDKSNTLVQDKSNTLVHDESQLERLRHGSGNHNATRGSTEGFALGEGSSTSFKSITSQNNPTDGLWASQTSRELFVLSGDQGPSSQRSYGMDSRLVGLDQQLTDHTYPGVPIPDLDRYSLSGLDSDNHSVKDSYSHSLPRSAGVDRDVGRDPSYLDLLTSKLKSAEVINQTLKDELKIYENITTSVGVGTSMVAHTESPSPLGTSMCTQTSMLAEDSTTALLREHLVQIGAMRVRLEASLQENDHLRAQMERQYAQERSHHSGHNPVHGGGREENSAQLHQKLIFIQSQLTERELTLHEKLTVIEKHEHVIREKDQKLEQQSQLLKQKVKLMTEKENQCKKLAQQRDKLNTELKSANKEIYRLKQEKTTLNEQLQEHQQLNKTLRFELEMTESFQSDRPGGQGPKQQELLIRELMAEMRKLRVLFEKSIDNNNALRQKLEELLRQESPRSQRGGEHRMRLIHSTDSSRHDSKEASDGMPSPDAHSHFLSSQRTVTERYVEEQETRIRSQGSYNGFRGSHNGLQGSHNGLQGSHNGSQGSHNSSQGSCSDSQVPRLNLPYGSSVELDRSGHSSEGSGHLVSGFDTLGSQNSQSSEERDVLFSSLHSPHGFSRSWPYTSRDCDLGMSLMSGASLSGVHLSPSNHHQRPIRVRYASEGNMTYHVYDPPNSLVDVFPVRVDPDIRHLFAVGKVDDYEHLRKENNECRAVLSGVQARITERLSRFKGVSPSQSVEYSTLKELSMSVENLRMCLGEENRLIASFWITELPACDDKGEFFIPKLQEKNEQLQSELYMLKLKYKLLASAAKDAQTRLHATNRQKEDIEEAVIQQLSRTEKVLRHARGNLESKAKSAHRHKSGRKHSSSSAHVFS